VVGESAGPGTYHPQPLLNEEGSYFQSSEGSAHASPKGQHDCLARCRGSVPLPRSSPLRRVYTYTFAAAEGRLVQTPQNEVCARRLSHR
jgi:hypothetical protein